MSRKWPARELIAEVLDDGSFESWDTPIDISHLDEAYQRELRAAAERSGCDESVLTGRGTVGGRPVAVIASEFRFLAGSIGQAAAQRITAAVRRATRDDLPLLAHTASGGTRMQEGTPAFIHMVKISRALMDHRAAGLPYMVHLGHPTTGGVFASWGSLAHITVAEPGALIGFLGPKVYEVLHHQAFPPGVQVAENLAEKGVIDAVVPAEHLPALVERAVGLVVDPPARPRLDRREGPAQADLDTWQAIELTRSASRLGVREVLRHGADHVVRLQGTDEGENDNSMLLAIARIDGQPCVVVGQDRRNQDVRPMGPGALREARRAMAIADEMRLPLVTFIDTPGAELSAQAEEGAIAGEIARCIATMTTMSVPTVSVLLGQGCGGGALALLPAHTVVATENAWLSPLPPEGASAIVYGDADHASELAEAQRVSARDLHALGSIGVLIPEYTSDAEDATALSCAVAAEVSAQVRALIATGDWPHVTR